jgi:5-(carboxyamino)imidazole ribonucleotide synthase
MAAARLGYRTHVLCEGDAPAVGVATRHTDAAFTDRAALKAFAQDCSVVTCEFENVPVAALDRIVDITPVRPGRRAMSIAQDRLSEKDFLSGLGVRTARYRDVPNPRTIRALLADIGTPAILKTRTLGYDGRGQVRIGAPEEAEAALESLAGAPAILEGVVSYRCEISVIVARNRAGDVICYEPGENEHRDGILRRTIVPARITAEEDAAARDVARRIVEALDYVGVMGVELFVCDDGLRVNEIAPRVHNSGHWTQAGCAIDQFEQHIRAIADLPLGGTFRHAAVEMENLIGADLDRVPGLLAAPNVQLHLYGKDATRAGRKMGHANHVKPPQA